MFVDLNFDLYENEELFSQIRIDKKHNSNELATIKSNDKDEPDFRDLNDRSLLNEKTVLRKVDYSAKMKKIKATHVEATVNKANKRFKQAKTERESNLQNLWDHNEFEQSLAQEVEQYESEKSLVQEANNQSEINSNNSFNEIYLKDKKAKIGNGVNVIPNGTNLDDVQIFESIRNLIIKEVQ